MMNQAKRIALFSALEADTPNPRTELEYHSVFELLIAVMLSVQATDISVNKATKKLFPIANTPKALLDLGEENLVHYIRTIGLFRSKAKHIIQTCRLILEKYQGRVPEDREALESLPGVGRKTANVILNTAFGQPVIAVDTHIFRLANRTGLAPGKTVLEVEKKLHKVVPKAYLLNAHHWLILHGRYICKARKPECWHCSIEPICAFQPKTASPTL